MRAVSQLLTLVALTGLMAGCGQTPAPSPVSRSADAAEARVSPAARDKIAKLLIAEYKGVEWYTNAERKKLLLESLVATGSDLAVDLLIAEYQAVEWYTNKERKMMFLEMLQKLTSVPVEPQAEGLVDRARKLKQKLPSFSALQRLLPALRKDYEEAPKEGKKLLDGIIAKIQIIAPGTSR